MGNLILSFSLVLLLSLLLINVESKPCKPSGKLRGKKHSCNKDNGSDCCEEGKLYDIYKCSPKVTKKTKAVLTINGFQKNEDGGAPAECDGKYHSDDTPVVALSTGWFNNRKRCGNFITIYGNGKRVKAKVVDECDSTQGCDKDHDFQPPCPNNIVDASRAVWEALGVDKKDWGEMEVHWSDS